MSTLDGEAEALTRQAIDRALAGDAAALRLVLERLVPPARSRPITIELPKIETPDDALTAFNLIVQAVARGALDVCEAQQFADVLERHRRVIETVELERRLTAVEAEAAKR